VEGLFEPHVLEGGSRYKLNGVAFAVGAVLAPQGEAVFQFVLDGRLFKLKNIAPALMEQLLVLKEVAHYRKGSFGCGPAVVLNSDHELHGAASELAGEDVPQAFVAGREEAQLVGCGFGEPTNILEIYLDLPELDAGIAHSNRYNEYSLGARVLPQAGQPQGAHAHCPQPPPQAPLAA
jgi:hypothetical protein